TIQIANKPGNASAALTPHRGVVLTVTGHAMAKTMTSADKTSGPVRLGRLGRKTVTTASNVAAATVVEAEIVLRTLLSCHVGRGLGAARQLRVRQAVEQLVWWHDRFARVKSFRNCRRASCSA